MKLLKWIVINGLFAVVAYFALYEEIVYAQNFLMVAVWLITIITTLYTFNDGMLYKIRERRSPIPRWLGGAYDILFISALAAFGWFFHAVLYAIHAAEYDYIYFGDDELDVKTKTKETSETTS